MSIHHVKVHLLGSSRHMVTAVSGAHLVLCLGVGHEVIVVGEDLLIVAAQDVLFALVVAHVLDFVKGGLTQRARGVVRQVGFKVSCTIHLHVSHEHSLVLGTHLAEGHPMGG